MATTCLKNIIFKGEVMTVSFSCQKCYSGVSRLDTFCPECGWDGEKYLDERFLKQFRANPDKYKKEIK